MRGAVRGSRPLEEQSASPGEPAWTTRTAGPGTTTALATGVLGVTAELWSPEWLGQSDPAPLVVVHDGPDYAARGGLTHYLAVLAAERLAAPARALLLTAQPREVLYAASPTYTNALVTRLLPRVTSRWPTTGCVAVGASLGALAALHAQWHHPGLFRAMLLQSGSFFTPRTDPQESGFPRWREVTGFVAEVLADRTAAAALPPIALTCGDREENLLNNRLMAAHLREAGAAGMLTEVPGEHDFTCWRDGLDPSLRDLLVSAIER